MQITVFGVVWTLFLIVAFFQNNVRGITGMALFSMVLQCNNVAVIGSTGIGVQAYTVFVALVRLLLLPRRNGRTFKSVRSLFTAPLILLAYLMINLILIQDQLSQKWIKVIIIGIYAVFAFLLYRKRLSIGVDEQWIELVVDRILVFVLVVGVLQYLTCKGVAVFRPLLTTCIYNDTVNADVIFHSKPQLKVLYSTFMEPSYFSGFMVGMFALIAVRKKASTKNIVLLSTVAMEIVLSRSATGYGGLVIVLAILAMRFYGKKRIVRIMVPLAVIALLAVMLFNYSLLDQVIFSKSQTSSYRVRNNWNSTAWGYFLEHPLFGIGVGQSRASSLFHTILAEIGITGFLIYLVIIVNCVKQVLAKGNPDSMVGAAFAVVSVWICQIIACPDMNFAPFWMMLFILALASNRYMSKLEGYERGTVL